MSDTTSDIIEQDFFIYGCIFNFQDEAHQKTKVPVDIDAANLGDIPTHYAISALKSHEFPAVGAYVDPRIVTGFRYRVRPIQDQVSWPNDQSW
jgi:hypothetical protein